MVAGAVEQRAVAPSIPIRMRRKVVFPLPLRLMKPSFQSVSRVKLTWEKIISPLSGY